MSAEQQILIQIGFSDIDAKVYLHLIGKGPVTIFSLAQDSRIARTSVYKSISSLTERGLVKSVRKNNVLYVEAANPEVLLDMARNQVELTQLVLPTLLSRSQSDKHSPNINFFSGNRAVKVAIDEMYDRLERRNLKKLYTISHPEFLEYYPRFLPNLIVRKESLGIHTSLIAPYAAAQKTPKHYQTNQYRETRFMPREFPFHCTMIISEIQTLFLSFRNKNIYAMTIESATLCEMFKQLFLFIWRTLEVERTSKS